MLKVPDVGEKILMKALRHSFVNASILNQGEMYLCLFSNDYQPADNSTASDFDEANFEGYSRQLIGTSWSNPLNSQGSGILQTSTSFTFTKTSGGTSGVAYGYYVIGSGGEAGYTDDVMFAEHFGTGVSFGTAGDFVTVTPKLAGFSQY